MNQLSIKSFFVMCFMLLFSITFSQDPIIVFEGAALAASGKKMSGVSVKFIQNGKEVHSVVTGSNGRYAPYEAYYGYIYKIVFAKDGFVSKTVEINTKENFYEEDVEKEIGFPLNMIMIKKESGVDYSSIENKPVAKAHIDKTNGYLDLNHTFNNSRKREIDNFFKKLSDDAKNKDKRFTDLVKAGDKAYKTKNYESAVKNWKAALDVKDDVDLSIKVTDAEMLLDELNAGKKVDEKFDKLIKEGDDLLASNKFNEAIAKYTQAQTVKPKDSLPKTKIKAVADKQNQLNHGKVDKEFNDLMAKAEKEIKAKDYTNAIGTLKQAQTVKPRERLPEQKIKEINLIVANAAKNKIKYESLISQADGLFKSKSYKESKDKYKEALTYIPGEKHPIERIVEIDKALGELAKSEKDNKAKRVKYETFIKQADRLLKEKKYTEAKSIYDQASDLFADEAYPKQKIKEIDALIKQNEADYKALITEGDKLFGSKQYDQSILKYEQALRLKSDDQYPKNQIKEAEKLLGKEKQGELDAKKKRAEYDNLVDAANKHFKAKKYDLAKESYTKASALFPDETYPKEQLTAIDGVLKRQEEEYKTLVSLADGQFQKEEYRLAIETYKKALVIKEDAYPTTQIEKAKKLISDKEQANLNAEQKEKKYLALKLEADKQLSNQNFNLAKDKYQEALLIKPDADDAKKQIAFIDEMMRKRKERFDKYIAEADNLFGTEKYEVAIEKYEEALWVMPVEQYPKDQIELARKKLEGNKDLVLAEKEKEAKYKRLINKGNSNFGSENYIQAKENYTAALALKSEEQYPKDQLSLIEQRLRELEDKNALANKNAKKEKEYNDLISKADKDFDNQKYQEAKDLYKKAHEVKSEPYPQNQIEIINKKLAELTQSKDLRKQYDKIIAVADKKMKEKDYKTARNLYKRAINFNSSDTYPPLKISEIDRIEAELAKNQKLKEAEEAKRNINYSRLIKLADNNFDLKKYQTARDNYQEALQVKPNEAYPKQKIAELDVLMTEIANEREKYKQNGSDYFDMDAELYGSEVNMSEGDVNLIITKTEDNRQARNYSKIREYVDSLSLAGSNDVERNIETAYKSYKDYERIQEEITKEQGENDYAREASIVSFELFREYYIKEKSERSKNAKDGNGEIADQIDELKEGLIEDGNEGQNSIEKNTKNYEDLNDRLTKEKNELNLENIDKMGEIYKETTNLKERLIKEQNTGQESIERNAANYERLNDRFADQKEEEADKMIDKSSEIYDQTTDFKEGLIEDLKDGQASIEENAKTYEELGDRFADEQEEKNLQMLDFQGELSKDIDDLKEQLIADNADGQNAIEENAANYTEFSDKLAEQKQEEADRMTDKSSEIYDQTTELKESLQEDSKDGQASIEKNAKQYENLTDRLTKEKANLAEESLDKTSEIYSQTTDLKDNLIEDQDDGQATIEKNAKEYENYNDKLTIENRKEAEKEARTGNEIANQVDRLKEAKIAKDNASNLATESNAISYENLDDRLVAENKYKAEENTANADRNAKDYENTKDNLGKQKSDATVNNLALMFPEGVTQKIYQRKNEQGEVTEVTVRRIVVKGNKGADYRKTTNKMGSIYFKNGTPISDATWDIETSGKIVNK